MKPSLMIATPAYSGSVRYEHFMSALETASVLQDKGVNYSHIVVAECPWVGHARADIVAQFMAAFKSPDDRLLMIDQDVSWHAEDVVRCMKHNVEFLGAVQRDKQTGKMLVGAKGKKPGDTHGFSYDPYSELLIGIGRIATCFMMLKRSVFEKMIAAYPHLHVENARFAAGHGLAPWFYGFFAQPVLPGQAPSGAAMWPGEDTHFCDLWTAIGGKIFIDPWVELTHTVFHPMRGRLADEIQGIPPRDAVSAKKLEILPDRDEALAA